MGFLDEIINPTTAVQHITQGTEEWDRIRCGRFTASEIHCLMDSGTRNMTPEELKARPKTGLGSSAKKTVDHSKFSAAAETYIYTKVAETLTGRIQNNSYAFPLVYGTETEPEAAEYFQEQTGLEISECGFIPFGEHAGGSPDRFVEDDQLLEIKCPYSSKEQVKYLMLTDRFDLKRMHPDHYWQVMCNLLFTGKKAGHYVTYDPRFINPKHKMTHLVIEPVAEDFDLIINKIGRAVEEKLKLIKLLS